MAMELVITPKNRMLVGTDIATVTEGQSLVIETTPEGTEILAAEVPEGKVWSAKVWVEITESDA